MSLLGGFLEGNSCNRSDMPERPGADGSRRKGTFASTEAFGLHSLAAARKVVGHTVRRASAKDASCEGSLRLQTSAERLPLFHSKLCKGALLVWHSWQPEEGLAAAHLLV